MTLTLNGKKHTTATERTVADLIASLGLKDRPVVVELDQQALLLREHATTELREGCVVEVVQITAGG
jgi:thiamine biosynthesis protein ThiS